MKKPLRYLIPALVLLFGTTLGAQEESVALVSLTNTTITLDGNCTATISAANVVKGDLDADNNGINVPFDRFRLIIEDDNPDNGPQVDGCGEFVYRVEATDLPGFTTAWGRIRAEDKSSPVIQPFPTTFPTTLFCDSIRGVSLDNLPAGTSRCYRVDGQTGEVIAGSLAPALAARLNAGGGIPTALDGCSAEVEICVSERIERDADNPNCEPVLLTRTFTATDQKCGEDNAEGPNPPAVASYTIAFVRPDLADLRDDNFPAVVEIECDSEEGRNLSFGEVPAPRLQDLPFFLADDGVTRRVLEPGTISFCNFGLSFRDDNPIATCEGGYKIYRTYTVIDWCEQGASVPLVQTIKVGDFTGPVIGDLTQDRDFDGIADEGVLVFQANAGDACGAFLRLDQPGLRVTDNCSPTITLTADIFIGPDMSGTPIGSFNVDLNNGSTPEISTLLPVGSGFLRYTATDGCNNRGERVFPILIRDASPPVAICQDGLNVSLTSSDRTSAGGIAILTPEVVDGGSFDDCSGLELKVARLLGDEDPESGAYDHRVVLTCADRDSVRIGLRARDDGGQTNYCWLTVRVEDKSPPECVIPPDTSITCFDFYLSLPADITEATDDELNALFGTPGTRDNCQATVEQEVSSSVNNCGVGRIERTFTVTDEGGLGTAETCTQTIRVIGIHDYTIRFPADVESFCGDPLSQAGLEVDINDCDLVTREVEVDTFQGDAAECLQLRITYQVINWCEYNRLGQAYRIPRDFDGNNNTYEATFLYVEPRDSSTLADDVAYLDKDADRTNFNFRRPLDIGNDQEQDDRNGDDNGDIYPYGTDDSRGYFSYVQYARIFDEVAPIITPVLPDTCFTALGANCTGSVELTFQASDSCTAFIDVRVALDENLELNANFARDRFLTEAEVSDNAQGDYTVTLANVPTGQHAIRIQATDGCGNVESRVVPFCVEDGKAPTPICVSQLTATLMPNGDGTGMAAIWASDYITSDVQDCSGEVAYAIYTEDEASVADFQPRIGDDGIVLNCDSDQTTRLRVYAIDPAGQSDYCSTFVLVQRADNACAVSNAGTIAGALYSEQGNSLDGVSVVLSGRDGDRRAVSSATGYYEFTDLPEGDDYTVSAILNNYTNHAQGVSTFDLVLITRHILGTQEFSSPYQLLAADANNDTEVSVQDIISIRRLILGLFLEFPRSNAYRFVPADFVFPVNRNPWATGFPEVINENNLVGSIRDADFIAIMVGDVSGNGITNALTAGTETRRGRAATALQAPDLHLKAGETRAVTLTPGSAADLVGLQGTLTVGAAADLLAVDYGQMSPGDVNPNTIDRGLLPFSLTALQGLETGAPLITLYLRAREDLFVRDVLSVSDLYLAAEGYTLSGGLTDLSVEFVTDEVIARTSSLGQNVPNPVTDRTVITYVLSRTGPAQLTVTDLRGRTVLRRDLRGFVGENRAVLRRSELGRSGVYTYTVTAGDFTASRKMIVR